jgi:hypothetical protein
VWCVWVRGSPPYIGVWGSLWEPGSLNLVAHPRTALLALMVVGTSKWGQGGGLEGAAAPLACARQGWRPSALSSLCCFPARPRSQCQGGLGLVLCWIGMLLLSCLFFAFLESVFLMCSTCIWYVFLHSDNSTSTSGIWSIVNIYVCIDL